jgi:PAS domain S-box-containing protein
MKIGYGRFSVVTGFSILLMALITNAWSTRRQLGVQIDNQARMADSREALFELAQIELVLNEAETGQRGFLYTGDPNYLAPYNLANSQVASHIAHLEQLTIDKPNLQSQIPLLRSLIREKLGELTETVSLFQSGKTDEAKTLVLSDTGLLMMDRIRNLMREMGQQEGSLLTSRSAAYLRSKWVTIACIYITNFVAGLALMMLAYHRQMKAREVDARKIQTREEELREREALLRTVTDRSHVGLAMLGADRCYLYANSAYGKMFELNSGASSGRRASDVLSQIYEQISPWLDRAFSGERVNFEITVPATTQKTGEGLGRSYAISYEPLQTYGEPLRVIGVTIDVTARKRSQEIVRMTEERLRLAQHAAGLGTFDVELPSGKQTWSVPMLELFGLATLRHRSRANCWACATPTIVPWSRIN